MTKLSQLTLRTWVTFFILALLMGLNNVYSSLLTGWGEGGSIVSVMLCLLFLAKKQRNSIIYNLGQTMASAGAGVGFVASIVAAIYYYYAQEGTPWKPPLWELSFFILSISLMGVVIAVPFRRYVVEWFFPSGVACATIIRAVTSENQSQRNRARNIISGSGIISALLTLPTKVAWKAGGSPFWSRLPIYGDLTLSLDPLLYGIGIVIGPRIGASMVLGGLLQTYFLVPQAQAMGANLAELTRWIAVGLMTLPAFTSLVFAFIYKSHGTLPPGFHPKKPEEEEGISRTGWTILILVFLLAMGLAMITMQDLFGISWKYVAAGTCIAGPLCLALGKVASETGINPVRLIAIVLLFLFSLFESHSPATLLGMGICGAALASIAVDLFVDLRTGYLIRANPNQQIVVQFLGVILTSFVSVYFLDLLAVNFGFGEGKYFAAPGAIIWTTMAEAFSEGTSAIAPQIWTATGIASILGILLSLLENHPRTRGYTPSPFALGLAILLPFEISAGIFVGALLRTIAIRAAKTFGYSSKHQAEEDTFHIGSAIFAASALAGILAVILISLGVFYLPS